MNTAAPTYNFRLIGSLVLVATLSLSACSRQIVPLTTAPAPTQADPRTASLSEIINIVRGRLSANDPLAQVQLGFILGPGGEIQTGDASSARLDFTDGTVMRVAQNTLFTMQSVNTSDEGLLTRLQLQAGQIWVSLTGGTLEVETPIGVAAVRGSFATFIYTEGDPADPNDDLLVIDCLEGECSAENDTVNERAGNLERIVITRNGQVHFVLTDQDVTDFIARNPEVATALVATLTAAPPPTETPQPTPTATQPPPPTDTPTEPAAPSLAPSATATQTPTATPRPVVIIPPPVTFVILGQHTVRPLETLFCIGRAYGVDPFAIAQANGNPNVVPGLVLKIPAVRWNPIPPGLVCPAQFNSGFVATATPTKTSAPAATQTSAPPPAATNPPAPTATATPKPPTITPTGTLPPTATASATSLPTNTATATATNLPTATNTNTALPTNTSTATLTPFPTSTPTATSTPFPTSTPTRTNTPTPTSTPDVTGPTISNFSASPTSFSVVVGTPAPTPTPPPACTVTFSADITDPSGVVSATVNWSATYLSTTTTGNAAMLFTTGNTWQAVTTVHIPNGGTLSWTVTATDAFANTTGPLSGSPNITTDFSNACP